MFLEKPSIPLAPRSMQKGIPLKGLLGSEAVACLARNIGLVHSGFDEPRFVECALNGLEPLELMQRGLHIAKALRQCLPVRYAEAAGVLMASLTPAQMEADAFGLSAFFYLPHSCWIAEYGQDWNYNSGQDPFDVSMGAMHALTMRFTAEFAIRPFLIQQQERTLGQLMRWVVDPNPHVRRLCSEGCRPRLPWGRRIPALLKDPTPTLPILEMLKDDASLYVRRCVANHLGDIAKSHSELAFSVCERWLDEGASDALKWVIRHAVRYPAKQGDVRALAIREAAKVDRRR